MKIRYFFALFGAIILLSTTVYAADTNSIVSEQAKLSGADEIESLLDDDAKQFFRQNGITPENGGILDTSLADVFSYIWATVKGGALAPLATGGALIAVILISACLTSAEKGKIGDYASVAAAAALSTGKLFATVSAAAKVMKALSSFMVGFLPVFAVITAAAGGSITAVSSEALLLFAAEAVSFTASYVVVPLMGGYIALSVAESVSPLISGSGIAEGVKKIATFLLSFISTVFVGVLGLKTAVASAGDSISMKTAKFLLGSTVPVAGSALSEALSTVKASMSSLKAGVGIYGVIACAVILLPILAELLVWRIVFIGTSAVAGLFGAGKLQNLLKGQDCAASLIITVILLCLAVFVISLSILLSAGGG